MNKLKRRFLNPYTINGNYFLTIVALALLNLFAYGYVNAEKISQPGMSGSVKFAAIAHAIFVIPAALLFTKDILVFSIKGEPPLEEIPYDYKY